MNIQGKTATEIILTAPSLKTATLMVTLMRRNSPLLSDPSVTQEKLQEFWETISKEDAEIAMFVASSVYAAYTKGLKHGKAGTPLDTSMFDNTVADLKQRHENPPSNVP